MENRSIEKLQEYLRIKTVHPEPDYGKIKITNNICFFCIEFKKFKYKR